jgi:tetrapyrrole methylase family protein/MazG family protein
MTNIYQRTLEVDDQTRERAGAPGTHPEFDRLVRTIWRLRQPDGCPWDREQSHRSIAKNMIEEAYEAVECIEAGDDVHLREELGDVLEQVLLHAQIACDGGVAGGSGGPYDIDDVCRELNEKLVRRHPHVFGDAASVGSPRDGAAVLDIWDDIKAEERADKGEASGEGPGLLDSVPVSLPALMQCQKISKRAAKAGFEWESVADVWDKVAEERAEYEAEEPGSEAAAMEFGDLLFALVNVARKQGIDAEEALAASNRKFRRRWSAMERAARAEGADLSELSTQRLNELWDAVKAEALE